MKDSNFQRKDLINTCGVFVNVLFTEKRKRERAYSNLMIYCFVVWLNGESTFVTFPAEAIAGSTVTQVVGSEPVWNLSCDYIQ